MRTKLTNLALASFAMSTALACAPTPSPTYPTRDPIFSDYESAELESERKEYIEERQDRLDEIQRHTAELAAVLSRSSKPIDVRKQADLNQRLLTTHPSTSRDTMER